MRYRYEDWCHVMRIKEGGWYISGFYRSVYYALGPIAKLFVALVAVLEIVLILLFLYYAVSIEKQYSSCLWIIPMIFVIYIPPGFSNFSILVFAMFFLLGGLLSLFLGDSHITGVLFVIIVSLVSRKKEMIIKKVIENKMWVSKSTFECLAERSLIVLCWKGHRLTDTYNVNDFAHSSQDSK